MSSQRHFVLMMAAAVATPALGQTVAPAIGLAVSATQDAASIPDFSGKWVYPFCCGFVPPLSGPGPVINRSREPQIAGEDGLPLPAGADAPLVGSRFRYVGDYTNPILKPQAAQIVKTHGEIEASGVPYPTPRNQCWPEGVPFAFANMGMHLLQQPDKITILYEHDHQVRQVRMNASHPAQVIPSWTGIPSATTTATSW